MDDPYVVILSSSEDLITNRVVDHLLALNIFKVLRINATDKVSFSFHFCEKSKLILRKNEVSYELKNIHAFWHRHGHFYGSLIGNLMMKPPEAIQEVSSFINRECEMQSKFAYEYLQSNAKRTLGVIQDDVHNNKLLILKEAYSCGLLIPETKLVAKDSDALSFMLPNRRYVTKPLTYPPCVLTSSGEFSTLGTKELFRDELINEHSSIQPYLVQELIEKEFEIRTFFLRGELFSMAIFSQLTNSSSLDFRNHKPDEGPMHMVPYKLPEDITKKINVFMNRVGLDTGSIDFIRSRDGKYYFLEVNSQGQFGWLSVACNYCLEEKIAKYLAYG